MVPRFTVMIDELVRIGPMSNPLAVAETVKSFDVAASGNVAYGILRGCADSGDGCSESGITPVEVVLVPPFSLWRVASCVALTLRRSVLVAPELW